MKKIILFIFIVLNYSCTSEEVASKPLRIKKHHECAVDGMILSNFSGPKAQIHFKSSSKSKVDFYCETSEMFRIYLEPGMEAQIKSLFVQDTSVVNWLNPSGGWFDALEAIYVGGSRKEGAMGSTYAPFSNQKDALQFIKAHGGKIYNFQEALKSLD